MDNNKIIRNFGPGGMRITTVEFFSETTASVILTSTKEAKGSALADGSPMQVSRKGNHMKRNRSDEVHSSGSKRPKKQRSLGTNPSLQLNFIDRSDLDGKISPEKGDQIEERLIEFILD